MIITITTTVILSHNSKLWLFLALLNGLIRLFLETQMLNQKLFLKEVQLKQTS